jgi:hypothetical protein
VLPSLLLALQRVLTVLVGHVLVAA